VRARRVPRPVLVVAACLGLTVGVTVALAAVQRPADAQSDLEAEGRELYETGCISCHGTEGAGVKGPEGDVRGPSIVDAGEAGAYYQLSTGRMPLANSSDDPVRKPPAYSPTEIRALVAYVASLGNGPPLPSVDLDGADVAAGGELFRANCQACHSAAGSGGALSYGRAAPALHSATPEQIAAAVRSGPGQMPVFGDAEIDQRQLDELTAYVRYLREPEDPGGFPIGRIGPIPEGFVAWSVGIVALLALVFWIGTRSPIRRKEEP